MSDVLPDNCGWGATREPVHCRGATSKSSFPTIQASSFLRTASLKHAKTSWNNCLFTIWPRTTNSWWTMPFQSKNTTNNTLIFDRLICALFDQGDPFLIHCDDCILQLKCLCKILIKFAAKFHTHTRCSSSCDNVKWQWSHFVTNPTNS